MELADVYSDLSGRLFFEFKKEGDEVDTFTSKRVKEFGIQFELVSSGNIRDAVSSDPIPSKNVYFVDSAVGSTFTLSVDMGDLSQPYTDLLIRHIVMRAFLYSGEVYTISVKKAVRGSEIASREYCIEDLEYLSSLGDHQKPLAVQEKICREVEVERNGERKKSVVVYEKNTLMPEGAETLVSTVIDTNERLRRLENKLEEVMKFIKGASAPAQTLRLPPIRGEVTRIKIPPASSPQKFPSLLPFMPELKDTLRKGTDEGGAFDFGTVLRPMSQEELDQIMLEPGVLEKRALRNAENGSKSN